MKQITFLFLIILSGSCGGGKKLPGNTNRLDGTWIPVRQEMGGKTFPEAMVRSQKLVLKDSSYTLTAESVDKGRATYSDNHIDIYGEEGVNKGKHFTGLYKLENDELTICYNLAGDGYPTAFETLSKPMLFMSVFKREK